MHTVKNFKTQDWKGCVDGGPNWDAELKQCQLADIVCKSKKTQIGMNLISLDARGKKSWGVLIWRTLIHWDKANCDCLLALYLLLVSDYTLGEGRMHGASLHTSMLCFAIQMRNISSIRVAHPFRSTQFRHLNSQIPLWKACSSSISLPNTSPLSSWIYPFHMVAGFSSFSSMHHPVSCSLVIAASVNHSPLPFQVESVGEKWFPP